MSGTGRDGHEIPSRMTFGLMQYTEKSGHVHHEVQSWSVVISCEMVYCLVYDKIMAVLPFETNEKSHIIHKQYARFWYWV